MTQTPPPKNAPEIAPEIALEQRAAEEGRLSSPTAGRNRDVVRDAFVAMMPNAGSILEVGCGTGEHAVHIASSLPDLQWRPTDPDQASRQSVAAWTAHLAITNIAPPEMVDVMAPHWGAVEDHQPFAGIFSANMLHIAPFEAAHGLFAGVGRLLGDDGKLFLYGPFSRNGVHTAPSNQEFDATLKARDPRWGVRDLEQDLLPLATEAGLVLRAERAMPRNNFAITFARAPKRKPPAKSGALSSPSSEPR